MLAILESEEGTIPGGPADAVHQQATDTMPKCDNMLRIPPSQEGVIPGGSTEAGDHQATDTMPKCN